MKNVAMVLLLFVALPATADFRDVEHDLRSRLGSPTYIPLIGLARFATWCVHPKGVHDFQMTVWDEKPAQIDGDDLEQLLRRGLSRDFQPLIRARSRKEWTFIYARPIGDRFEMMLLTHDESDTVLIRADVDVEQLSRAINEPRSARSMGSR
jgi:hypothetical protein